MLCVVAEARPVGPGADVDPSVFLSPWQCWEGGDRHELGKTFKNEFIFIGGTN